MMNASINEKDTRYDKDALSLIALLCMLEDGDSEKYGDDDENDAEDLF